MLCKVIKKEIILQKAEDVYDISVKDYHNFILSNGTIVHNCDTYQSADLKQQLLSHGIQCETISVDRVQNKVCEPYLVFKNAIYEKRLVTYPTKLLSEEVVGLVKDANGKVDHDPNGVNSKDQCDACCGSLYAASQHAEEYAYDYGESLDVITQVSNTAMVGNEQTFRQQVNIDFEAELQRAFDPMRLKLKENPNSQSFSNTPSSYVSDGILIW